MTDSEPLYDVRNHTGNPKHPSVDEIVDLVLKRAENPREDQQDAHLDEAMATVVDRYSSETVRTVIQRVLVDGTLRRLRRRRSTVLASLRAVPTTTDESSPFDSGYSAHVT